MHTCVDSTLVSMTLPKHSREFMEVHAAPLAAAPAGKGPASIKFHSGLSVQQEPQAEQAVPSLCCLEKRSPVSCPENRADYVEQKRMKHSPCRHRTWSAPSRDSAGSCGLVFQEKTSGQSV